MPIRQDIKLNETVRRTQSSLEFLSQLLICFVLLAFGPITQGLAQDAQKPQTPPDAPSSSQTPDKLSTADQVQNALLQPMTLYNFLQAKSIVFPDIAVNDKTLSTGQKFKLFVDNSISVHTVTWAVLGSAVGQADDSPTGFGQGWDAYAKRFGSSMARQSSSEFFGTFILASALHQDPRFYSEIRPSFFHAAKYSIQRVFIMRNDNGRDGIAWSRLIGPAMAEGLANVYWPEQNRTVGDTFFRYGLDLATRAGGNMLREYWPVFYDKIHHEPRPAARHN
jgi:hypothetical protein